MSWFWWMIPLFHFFCLLPPSIYLDSTHPLNFGVKLCNDQRVFILFSTSSPPFFCVCLCFVIVALWRFQRHLINGEAALRLFSPCPGTLLATYRAFYWPPKSLVDEVKSGNRSAIVWFWPTVLGKVHYAIITREEEHQRSQSTQFYRKCQRTSTEIPLEKCQLFQIFFCVLLRVFWCQLGAVVRPHECPEARSVA